MDQEDSRDPRVGLVGENSSPMDFESAVLGWISPSAAVWGFSHTCVVDYAVSMW